jgi:predicted transcriptional regulator
MRADVVSVRMENDLRRMLDKASGDTGLERSFLIRLALSDLFLKSENKEIAQYGDFMKKKTEWQMRREQTQLELTRLTHANNVSKLISRLKKQGMNSAELNSLSKMLKAESKALGSKGLEQVFKKHKKGLRICYNKE